jgi:hypothetical protein
MALLSQKIYRWGKKGVLHLKGRRQPEQPAASTFKP